VKRLLKIFLLAIFILLHTANVFLVAQSETVDEMDRIERVSELQDQLDAEQMSQRDAAEKALINLGQFALEHLDDATDDMPLDKVERLARIRAALETQAVKAASQLSKVTLDGVLSVDEALKRIISQTKNDVAISEGAPVESGQATLTWTGDDIPFWDAISKIQRETGLVIDPYAADGSKLRLVPAEPKIAQFLKDNPAIETTANMFHVRVTRVDATRNLTHPNLDHVSLQLLIRWEPRLIPISLKLPASSVTGKDSDGGAISVPKSDAVYAAMIQPEIPEVQLTIPLKPVDRDVTKIESLTLSFDATLPGRTETFRFRRVGKLPAGKKIDRAGATVTLEGIDKNEDLFGITLSLSFDEELNALESHQSWVFDNPVYLENEQGQRSKPLTYESIRQDNNRVAVTYYFAEAPGERTLVYKTAAAILQVQSKVELNDIPLP
jgi:hypothetical protein